MIPGNREHSHSGIETVEKQQDRFGDSIQGHGHHLK
jgi:hypothetical protein